MQPYKKSVKMAVLDRKPEVTVSCTGKIYFNQAAVRILDLGKATCAKYYLDVKNGSVGFHFFVDVGAYNEVYSVQRASGGGIVLWAKTLLKYSGLLPKSIVRCNPIRTGDLIQISLDMDPEADQCET